MWRGFKRVLNNLAGITKPVYYSDRGNRSSVNLDFRSYLEDPQLVRLFTEYRANGQFTGILVKLTHEDAEFVNQINTGLRALSLAQGDYGVGTMWEGLNKQMLQNALTADPRLYNHIGSLSYKTFKPLNRHLEGIITEVVNVLVGYDHLVSRVGDFEGLFVDQGSPFFTFEGHKLNSGIRALEEFLIITEKLGPAKDRTILEIGGGSGQLANLFLRDGAKVVIVDLPGLHARGPYYLRKSGHRVCTYDRYVDGGRDIDSLLREYDVIYLPPWEAESLQTSFDLAINSHSLGEMSIKEVVDYLQLIDRTCECFFSLNTNTNGLDLNKQPGTEENSHIQYVEHLPSMEPVATGTTISDTAFTKILHYAYVLYKRSSSHSGRVEQSGYSK